MTINTLREYLLHHGQLADIPATAFVQLVVEPDNRVVATLFNPSESVYIVAASHIEGLLALCDQKGAEVRIE